MRTVRHLAIGIALAALWALLTRAHHPSLLVSMLATGILIVSFAAAVYCNQVVLIPRLWRTNQRIAYAVALLITIIVSTGSAVSGIQYVYDVIIGPDPLRYGFWFNFWTDLAGTALHLLVAAAIFKLAAQPARHAELSRSD